MLVLFACLIAVVFFLIFNLVGRGIEKGVDKGVDAVFDAAERAKKHGTPIVKSVIKSVNQAKEAIFRPNTFCIAWHFTDFVRLYGPNIGIAGHTTKEGKLFHTCEVSNNEGKTFSIRFSASLGELNAQQLKDRKDKLFVGKTNNGKYYLYDEYFKDWEDVKI